jgi:hypothetical protein
MSVDPVEAGISKLAALGKMAAAINGVLTPHGTLQEIPDETLRGYHEMTAAYAGDLRRELERRSIT